MSVEISDPPFPTSPVAPTQYEGDHVIQFSCHKGIGCFNACCKNIDITLTPYDILRLKNRLGIDSREFLREYTVPYEMEKDGLAGVKFKPVDNGTACRFMTEEGCSVYEDRPTACRYYPVGLLSMRRADEYVDRDYYALVEEDHCLGHQEDRKLTIDEYRQEQGLVEYDDKARGWRQLILKKKSSGPTVGTPSKRSRQLFFMACYDLDSFREFLRSEGFRSSFVLPEDEYARLLEDDEALLQFAFRFLKQVLFGEESIPVHPDALAAREARLKALAEARAAQKASWEDKEGGFDSAPIE
ncbi:YkgJ family cysteine cluster protein [Thiohalobacter sp. IOR34]|uniref:YkgJ family cysteine cluster protein n=1 Tax=Thiohalobacter sp. IOR34 TaxID=3057176 RepID=UPI0025AED8D6|nr:YkgJ family cysteine cluster protein [Thiohalobacter sp. IOR34]WJW75347.1 YkgJ family cysteine cluster protein [Thiohalobacter sp. IOR34]